MNEEISARELVNQLDEFQKLYSIIERTILKKNQLNASSFSIMSQLIDQPLTLKQLTSLFSLDKSTLSRQVNELVRQGFILKETGTDKRVFYLNTSKEAKQLINAIQYEIEFYIYDLFKLWPNDEKRLLMVLLGRMNRRIRLTNELKVN
ncbi:DNA-binding transcriptional regulator, MarR family [Carnobacterium iners]|uniref:DNA-binding transcriptional regulator, MarR family n=1 Tax=Carnobacterium iners TaxID=1073423 RepID=A0A1X7NGL7_9LACT|nr:MarR family transcriptional regulator [Carnobacterium iners]SEK38725.1 DNA-binding transcriptional regulator, MarR family [Carnobacterium iners]SMH36259.1 DNA-binding transcriptional regulator, MarR family [Carnobacterium iners]